MVTMPRTAIRASHATIASCQSATETHLACHVEFGYKAQVTGNDDGIVLDCAAEYGGAPDGPQFVPAIRPARTSASANARRRLHWQGQRVDARQAR